MQRLVSPFKATYFFIFIASLCANYVNALTVTWDRIVYLNDSGQDVSLTHIGYYVYYRYNQNVLIDSQGLIDQTQSNLLKFNAGTANFYRLMPDYNSYICFRVAAYVGGMFLEGLASDEVCGIEPPVEIKNMTFDKNTNTFKLYLSPTSPTINFNNYQILVEYSFDLINWLTLKEYVHSVDNGIIILYEQNQLPEKLFFRVKYNKINLMSALDRIINSVKLIPADLIYSYKKLGHEYKLTSVIEKLNLTNKIVENKRDMKSVKVN